MLIHFTSQISPPRVRDQYYPLDRGTKMIWGNLKLRLIQTSRMAKSNQLFVISFALREPCLKLIKGQANMMLYEVVPK